MSWEDDNLFLDYVYDKTVTEIKAKVEEIVEDILVAHNMAEHVRPKLKCYVLQVLTGAIDDAKL